MDSRPGKRKRRRQLESSIKSDTGQEILLQNLAKGTREEAEKLGSTTLETTYGLIVKSVDCHTRLLRTAQTAA
jgi:hypothetical protein